MKNLVINFLFIFCLLFVISGCSTIKGTVEGVGRDIKAATIYARDAITGQPISD